MKIKENKVPLYIDWQRLFNEFRNYQLNDEIKQFDACLFVQSLIQPVPEFVELFLSQKSYHSSSNIDSVRDLFGYLLEKRYNERLNLIHFAFEIFDNTTYLPQAIIDQTPLPHEDGVPKYIHRNDPDFRLFPS